MRRSRAVLIKKLCKKLLVLQTIELKVLECLVLENGELLFGRECSTSQERKIHVPVEKYDYFVFPDSLECVKPYDDNNNNVKETCNQFLHQSHQLLGRLAPGIHLPPCHF